MSKPKMRSWRRWRVRVWMARSFVRRGKAWHSFNALINDIFVRRRLGREKWRSNGFYRSGLRVDSRYICKLPYTPAHTVDPRRLDIQTASPKRLYAASLVRSPNRCPKSVRKTTSIFAPFTTDMSKVAEVTEELCLVNLFEYSKLCMEGKKDCKESVVYPLDCRMQLILVCCIGR
jgi:hypothetical protein